MQDNYRSIEVLAEACIPFNGNTMTGEWDDGKFIVRSYAMIIGAYDRADGTYAINAKRVSNTTSRQQNLLKRAWANKANLTIEGN